MTLLTDEPNRILSVLKRSRVDYQLGRIVAAGALTGAQRPGVAERIVRMLKEGVVYTVIAAQCQVSKDTVMRVAKDPKKYGVDSPPLTRPK
jgi:hypothetical protein